MPTRPRSGLPGLALRFFNVYGPLQSAGHAYAAVIPTFVDAALRGEPLVINGDGQQARDFTFVGSVVSVLADAVLGRVTSAEPVNLAFGTRTSITDLAQRVVAAVGVPADIRYAQPRVPVTSRIHRPRATGCAGCFPGATPTGLDEGLNRTVAWFHETGSADGTPHDRARQRGHPAITPASIGQFPADIGALNHEGHSGRRRHRGSCY